MIPRPRSDSEPPEEVLRETARAWEEARREVSSAVAIEIYARRSERLRVRAEGTGARVEERGWDAGVAVRVHDPSNSSVGFASSAGSAKAVGAGLARIAHASRCGIAGSIPPWPRREGAPLHDVETSLSLPATDRLHGWLDEALGGTSGRPPPTVWLEVAATVEAVSAEGLSWVRSRGRVWAVLLEAGENRTGRALRRRSLAARRLEDLPPFPAGASATGLGEPAPPGPLVMTSDALAVLVPALARALHTRPDRLGTEVGAGWVLRDDPRHEAALVGGEFDDAGFEARPKSLARSRRVVGALAGPGSYRRGSYRDRPEPGPSLLVLDPPEIPAPDRGMRVRSIDLEAVGLRSWILRLDGERWIRGGPAGEGRPGILRTDPADLARACVGGTGEPGRCGWGVFSPPLVFEGLEVEG